MNFGRLVVLALSIVIIRDAKATLIDLDFATLPSQQGWTFSSSGPLEQDVATLDVGTSLTLDTMGASNAGVAYLQNGVVNGVDPFSVSIALSVPTEEIFAFGARQGFGFDVAIGGLQYGMLIGPAGLRIADGSGGATSIYYDIDMTEPHLILLEAEPGIALFSVSVDDSFAVNGIANTIPESSQILFGDGSSTANGRAVITGYSFTQLPEPSTALLLGLGLVEIARRGRKQAQSSPFASVIRERITASHVAAQHGQARVPGVVRDPLGSSSASRRAMPCAWRRPSGIFGIGRHRATVCRRAATRRQRRRCAPSLMRVPCSN